MKQHFWHWHKQQILRCFVFREKNTLTVTSQHCRLSSTCIDFSITIDCRRFEDVWTSYLQNESTTLLYYTQASFGYILQTWEKSISTEINWLWRYYTICTWHWSSINELFFPAFPPSSILFWIGVSRCCHQKLTSPTNFDLQHLRWSCCNFCIWAMFSKFSVQDNTQVCTFHTECFVRTALEMLEGKTVKPLIMAITIARHVYFGQ